MSDTRQFIKGGEYIFSLGSESSKFPFSFISESEASIQLDVTNYDQKNPEVSIDYSPKFDYTYIKAQHSNGYEFDVDYNYKFSDFQKDQSLTFVTNKINNMCNILIEEDEPLSGYKRTFRITATLDRAPEQNTEFYLNFYINTEFGPEVRRVYISFNSTNKKIIQYYSLLENEYFINVEAVKPYEGPHFSQRIVQYLNNTVEPEANSIWCECELYDTDTIRIYLGSEYNIPWLFKDDTYCTVSMLWKLYDYNDDDGGYYYESRNCTIRLNDYLTAEQSGNNIDYDFYINVFDFDNTPNDGFGHSVIETEIYDVSSDYASDIQSENDSIVEFTW